MAIPAVSNWFEAVVVSITAALVNLLSFIPALVGAIVILVIGWIIAGVLARLVTTVLQRVGFESAAQRTGVTEFLMKSGARGWTASRVLGELVKWTVRLVFLEAAASALHLEVVTELINRVVLFVPNLVVALVVLMVGALLARLLSGIVRGAAAEAGFSNPSLMGKVAQTAVLAFAVIVAVSQIGIATAIVNTLFMAVVGAVALAAALAFGLGGRDVAAEIWRQWYQRSRGAAPRQQRAAEAVSDGRPQ
jgi:mechanosensitive ion channel-like protein